MVGLEGMMDLSHLHGVLVDVHVTFPMTTAIWRSVAWSDVSTPSFVAPRLRHHRLRQRCHHQVDPLVNDRDFPIAIEIQRPLEVTELQIGVFVASE